VTAAGTLDRLAALAREAGAAWIGDEVETLAERLADGRFYVVCLGQFKRGKSTLLNALIGAPLLPTGVVPVTAAVTVVRHGERPAARVRLGHGEWQDCDPAALSAYVSEEQNPGNAKNVTGVEVFSPSPLLRSGLCLVDTPGIGSVSLANTETTRAFVPHVDAALVVLGSDPPITGDELALVREVAATVSDVIVVFSKADRQPEAERSQALAFTRRVLEPALARPLSSILQVSAVEHPADAVLDRDWGLLVERLQALARQSGADLVRAAGARETEALIDALQRELVEQRRTLTRPLQESAARVEALRQAVAEGERSLGDLAHLLRAEHERLSRRLAQQREAFLADVLPAAAEELREAVRHVGPTGGDPRARSLDLARRTTRQWLDRWREQQEPRAQALYREAEQRFIELVNGFQDRLAAAAGLEAFPRLHAAPGFRTRARFYYTELMSVAPASAAAWLHDRLLPWRRAAAIERAALAYLDRLLTVNSARALNDLEEQATESRRLLEHELRERLLRLAASAEQGLDRARTVQAGGAAAVAGALRRLDGLQRRLEALAATTAPRLPVDQAAGSLRA
jgi:GTP-binding protein EngB required for normal cell division